MRSECLQCCMYMYQECQYNACIMIHYNEVNDENLISARLFFNMKQFLLSRQRVILTIRAYQTMSIWNDWVTVNVPTCVDF